MFIRTPEDLGLQLMNFRKRLNLTQAQVADLVGLKQKTISNFENNPAGAEIETLFKIISALELNLEICPKSEFKSDWKEAW